MDHQHHSANISALSQSNGPLSPKGPTATIKNRAWFRQLPTGQYRPTDTRRQVHRQLLNTEQDVSPKVKQKKQAIVLAGPPGAGKSTVLHQILGDKHGQYRVLDADKFKEALLDTAVQDGSYNTWIKPAEVQALEAQGHRFYPLELASLVHEESSMLMKTLRDESIARGDNIVIDSVLSDETNALALGEKLEKAGYSIHVVDVEVPFEVSQQRIQQRWLQARQEAEQDGSGLGGRWVPSEFARTVFDGPDGKSKPEHAAQQLALRCGAVTEYRLFRTTTAQAQAATSVPTLERHLARATPNGPLLDHDVAQVMNRTQTFRPKNHLQHNKPRRGHRFER